MSNLLDFDYAVNCIVGTDASAALGMVHRVGLWRTRHIDVQCLWIQGEVQRKALRVVKVGTSKTLLIFSQIILAPKLCAHIWEAYLAKHVLAGLQQHLS